MSPAFETSVEIPSATSDFEILPCLYAILNSAAVVVEVLLKGVPAAGMRANNKIVSRTDLGKACRSPGGSNAFAEMNPAVAVMTTAAAFDATVVSHGHAAPPAQPSTAPLQVGHTATIEGRLRRMSITTTRNEETYPMPPIVETPLDH